ncbi:MAG TPA: 5-formyltetrahydrofolate cyclo-ligase [Ferruginibacter sp.]|jgi:5-formyltetrahydrofolate cyclo-ligase|nr:5-formyltetrahydrofolate cyclo-ligase [Ferruginibacter sp.]
MLKQEIRKIYKEKRLQLSHSEKEKLDDLLLIQFQKLSLPYLQVLLSYWPMAAMKEINTHTITDFIAFRNPGIRIAYPVSNFITNKMTAMLTDDDTEFSENAYGITEPVAAAAIPSADIDMVLVPLVAFDARGYRVGYGKGFYDRFLADCNKNVVKVGLSYFGPVDVIEDADGYDIKLDHCVTPDKIYDFTN